MRWLKYAAAILTFLLGVHLTGIFAGLLAPLNNGVNNFAMNHPPTAALVQGEPATSSYRNLEISDLFVDEESLAYNDYVVKKLYKKAKVENFDVDVSYIVVRRRGRTLLKFDEVYGGFGNLTQFGLVSLLGGTVKQLVISQDVPRGGNQWIVTLGKSPQIIYDGTEWGTGRESEDLGILDLDGDGIFEISAPVTAFYSFTDKRWSTMNTPLPIVIFKFDSRATKYLPANRVFSDYILSAHRERPIAPPDNPGTHLGDVMDKTLDYIFAQREAEGWALFERECKLPDKEKIRRSMQMILDNQPTYRYLKRKKRLDLHHKVGRSKYRT